MVELAGLEPTTFPTSVGTLSLCSYSFSPSCSCMYSLFFQDLIWDSRLLAWDRVSNSSVWMSFQGLRFRVDRVIPPLC